MVLRAGLKSDDDCKLRGENMKEDTLIRLSMFPMMFACFFVGISTALYFELSYNDSPLYTMIGMLFLIIFALINGIIEKRQRKMDVRG